MTTKATIVIPNYNNRNLLEELLNSLKTSSISYNIIIIDNASKDDSINFIRKYYPEIKLIENKKNMGFAYAVNQGIKFTNTQYVILLNNDTVVDKNTINELITTIERSKDIFSASAKMIQYSNKNLIDDAGDEYTLLGWSKKNGFNHSITEYGNDKEVFSACAGAAIYKTELFKEIGLFDEKFVSYVEDMDLSFRSRLCGYKSYYSSNAIVYHHGSATTGSQYNPFKIRISARNNIYLIYKNMPLWMKIINILFLTIGFIVKYLFFVKKGYGKYYKKGVFEGIKTRKNLTKTKRSSTINYLKIEWLMIKNTFKYPF